MKFATVLLFFTINFMGCNGPNNKKIIDNSDADPILLSMEKHADSLVLDAKISSVSIGIFHNGKEYIGHYGELDNGKQNKPTDSTIYEIASVSKTMAGVLAAQAELDGRLDLDDDVRKYLDGEYPNLEYHGHPIRIKHLLTHTSRLPKYLPEDLNALFDDIDETLPFKIHEIEKGYGKQAFYADLHQLKLDTIPGTIYDYSNVDTELLAHILERIYKKDYEQLLKEYVLDKAGMPNTKINLTNDDEEYLANGYGETRKIVPHLINPLWGAGGGVKSTMPDLINYMKFQLDATDQVVQRSHQLLFDTPEADEKIAYYWPVATDEEDGTYYGHHGGSLGMQNYFFIFPKHHMGFSIITNQSDQETAAKLKTTVGNILDDIR